MGCCGNQDAKCCGHPAGGYIWVPLLCAIASLTLSITSLANVTYTACKFAKLNTAVSINGLSCDIQVISYATLSGKYECSDYVSEGNGLGLFMFHDAVTGSCIPLKYATTMDPFFIASYVCCAISGILGAIVALWLLFATCCPLRLAHKFILQWFSLLASLFQGASILLFFGNHICKEAGCSIDEGAYYAIAAAAMYFVTNLVLLFVKPTRNKDDGSTTMFLPSESSQRGIWRKLLGEKRQKSVATAMVEPNLCLIPGAGACGEHIEDTHGDIEANSTVYPDMCGVGDCCNLSHDEASAVNAHSTQKANASKDERSATNMHDTQKA